MEDSFVARHNWAREAAKRVVSTGSPVLLRGYPGTGKTLIARYVTELLGPPVEIGLVREIMEVYRATGHIKPSGLERPFRAPHHTISKACMEGSRPNPDTAFPYYGELSLAHGGVLFLDNLPEFDKAVLDAVACALRDKHVIHGTKTGNVTYPATFFLVASENPCPCGFAGKPGCQCSDDSIARYQQRYERVFGERGIELGVIDLRDDAKE